jgi:hypothetical protein
MSRMSVRWRRALAAVPLLLCAAALGTGCKINSVAPASCVQDDQCGAGFACMSGSCITQGVPHGTWAIELLPRSDSPAAPTEFSAIGFSDEVTVLTATAKVTVSGNLPAGSAFAGNSHVIATVQTTIPGHADLQVETDWLVDPGASAPPPFSLTVPASTIGQVAKFRLSPLFPANQGTAPVTIAAKLAPTLDLIYVNDSSYIDGRLVMPTPGPMGGFVARALQAGQLVSNVIAIAATGGTFHLEIPPDAAYATTGRPITVEIAPSGSQYTTPRFVTPTVIVRAQANVNLGDLTLPTVVNALSYRFKIVDPAQLPVVGAAVRVRTVLASDDHGVADFLRDGTSDENGNVDLALLPGSATAAQNYEVSVIPPASTTLGIACLSALPLTNQGANSNGGAPTVAAVLQLPSKVSVFGTVAGADGQPVPGVAISATRTAADPNNNCASSIVSAPTGVSSGKDGTFQLLVDPGTYRFDYDPPAGAAVPRLTETNMVVTDAGTPNRTVQLPEGALVKGAVRDSNGNALAFVGVRFFEIACSGQDACFGANRVEPMLSADTHTDADGNFRAVVPPQTP